MSSTDLVWTVERRRHEAKTGDVSLVVHKTRGSDRYEWHVYGWGPSHRAHVRVFGGAATPEEAREQAATWVKRVQIAADALHGRGTP